MLMSESNGLSNTDVEERTWEWFSEAVTARFGPAYYQLLGIPAHDHWPDRIALRAHSRVAFEITSPLRPEDVVPKNNRHPELEAAEIELPMQVRLEQRVIEALRRKIRKYGSRNTGMPLALLITLAHPSAQPFFGAADLRRLSGVVRGHVTNFLHQPLDAVYLVGPGQRAVLLWRRRGSKWKKLFPELGAA